MFRNTKQKFIAGASAFAILALVPQMFETNSFGDYQIKQAAGTGKISIKSTPGLYIQGFGNITTYRFSDEYSFADKPVVVRFNEGSTGEIYGMVKYRLSADTEKQKLLHRDFKSDVAFRESLIRQVVEEAIKTTSTYFSAESTYTSGRVEYSSLVEEQIKEGLFETKTLKATRVGEDGTKFLDSNTTLKRDEDGNAIVKKISPFKRYGIEVLQVVIQDVDPDDTIKALISKKKEAEQMAVLAKQNAEKAKQDAITTREEGKASVAKAEAEALIIKKTAVIEAEKNRAVAEENAKKALAEAKATKAAGEAEAYAANLKVKAGLTPLEKATIKKETAIGVAKELSNVKFPEMMIIGGSGDKGTMNPFDAVGLESFIKIQERMTNKK